MAEDYTRVLARVAAGQLAEIAGYEAVQESAVEILADLLLHYLSELSSGANAYANLASRSDINVNDVALAIEDLGSSVEELAAYASSLSSDDNTFVHTVPPYPVRRPARPVPTFEEKEEQPPAHIPSFLPAFPDPHTFEHTPAFPGHELNPQKQTEVVQQQRRAAEKALVQLHKRAKPGGTAPAPGSAPAPPAAGVAGAAGAAGAGAIAVEEVGNGLSDGAPLSQPPFGLPRARADAGVSPSSVALGGLAAAGPGSSREGVVSVPEQALLGACPHHVVFDRALVVRQLGPALEALHLPGLQPDVARLTDVFEVIHPALNASGQQQQQQQQEAQQGDAQVAAPLQPSLLDASLFTRNPFQTFVLRSKVAGQGSATDAPPLQLQGHVVAAQLRLKRRPLPGVQQDGAEAAGGTSAGTDGVDGGAGWGAGGSVAGVEALGEPEEVLLLLAAPRTATDEQLQAMQAEAEAALAQSQRSAARKRQLDGSRAGARPDAAATDAAFKALVGGDGEVAWKCTSHFEDNGGPLKPTFAAGFSQDWATATRRSALALASRREQEDAYKELQKGRF